MQVPIIKATFPDVGIAVDICFQNTLALHNSDMLRCYMLVDERARELVFAIKAWAKARGINNTRQGTLSSYAYVNMVIFYLQTRAPAVLPRLQDTDSFKRLVEVAPSGDAALTAPVIVETRVNGYPVSYLSDVGIAKASLSEANNATLGSLLYGVRLTFAYGHFARQMVHLFVGAALAGAATSHLVVTCPPSCVLLVPTPPVF